MNSGGESKFHTPSNKGMPGDSHKSRARKVKITSRFFEVADDEDAEAYSRLLEDILSSTQKEVIETHGGWSKDGARVIFIVYREYVDVKKKAM